MMTTAVIVGIALMLGAGLIVRAANKFERPKTARKAVSKTASKTVRRRKK